MAVQYEWDVESVANGDSADFEDGEVLDHYHCATFAEAAQRAASTPLEGCRHAVVLVRDDDNGRSWAYVEGGALPEHFTDANGAEASKVPQRFVREVERSLAIA